MNVLPLERGLDDLPVVYESEENIMRWYYESENFVPLPRYPQGFSGLLDGEFGYMAIFSGTKIFPILRVCKLM